MPTPYLVLGVIFGFIFIIGIWQATVPAGNWMLTLLTGAAFFLTMLWFGTIRIQYSEGELSYHTLFTGTRSALFGDIESAETKLIGTGKGPCRLFKVFSKEDIGRLFDLLGAKFKGSRRIGIYSDKSA